MDVIGAFLNAPCDRDVFVRPTPGQATRDPSTGEAIVYKLHRSLYGLSQSPARWIDTLDQALTVFGWKRTQSDPCMYHCSDGTTTVFLTVYVDDFLITGENYDLVTVKKKN